MSAKEIAESLIRTVDQDTKIYTLAKDYLKLLNNLSSIQIEYNEILEPIFISKLKEKDELVTKLMKENTILTINSIHHEFDVTMLNSYTIEELRDLIVQSINKNSKLLKELDSLKDPKGYWAKILFHGESKPMVITEHKYNTFREAEAFCEGVQHMINNHDELDDYSTMIDDKETIDEE